MSLPIYRHPSLTVLIDDSDSFLKSVAFQLDPALASKCFADTSSALAWIGAHAEPQPGRLAASHDTYPDAKERCNVAFDIDQIHRISFEPERFMTPSVVVVDYSMPQMDGLELCEALRHLPCKKILFTGVADEKVAVDAFNRGLIDRYIKKSDDAALDKLEAEIVALQQAYFAARSDPLRDLLKLHNHGFLSDPAFSAVVAMVVEQHGIVEHYLYSSPAGLLLYDASGRAQLMVVETEAGMNAHYEVGCDNDAPPSFLQAVRERCIVPYFREGDGMYARDFAKNWHRWTAPAQRCRGAQNGSQNLSQIYYWALFPLAPGELDQPAHPFSSFLREREMAP